MCKRYKLHTEHITLILPGLSHYMDFYVGFYLTMYVYFIFILVY